MDDKLSKILEIVVSKFETAVPKYEEIELFPLEGVKPHSFEEFLIKNRVHLFLKLFILNHLGEASYVPAFDSCVEHKVEFEPDEEGHEEEIWIPIGDFGPNLLDCSYTDSQVFEEYLDRIGVASLLIREGVRFDGVRRFGTGGLLKLEGKTVDLNTLPEIFVMVKPDPRIVLTDTSVFVDANDEKLLSEIKSILATHKDEFAKFVSRHEETGVPHSVYIEWLMKWYPGKVHLRSLE